MKASQLGSVIFQLLLTLNNPVVAAATTQSIASDVSWQALDPCAQNCFQTWIAGCWAPQLDMFLQCVDPDSPYCVYASNDCYCRADHQPIAVSYLSSCVSKSCTIGDAQIDVNSAVTVYDGYCTSNAYLVTAPASTAAQTTQSPMATTTVPLVSSSLKQSPTSSTGASSVTSVANDPSPTSLGATSFSTTYSSQASTTTSTSSESPSSSSNSSSGLSVGDIAAIASVIIGAIALVVAFFTMPKKYRTFFCCSSDRRYHDESFGTPGSYSLGETRSNHHNNYGANIGTNSGVINGGINNVIYNFFHH